jgi:hypothetical protein
MRTRTESDKATESNCCKNRSHPRVALKPCLNTLSSAPADNRTRGNSFFVT